MRTIKNAFGARVKVDIDGDGRLVSVASAGAFGFGWELQVTVSEEADAYVIPAAVCGEVPMRVVFDVIPNDWTVNQRTSTVKGATVWFTAESAEEARALRNLARAERGEYDRTVRQVALKPGFIPRDAVGLLLDARG